MLSFFTVLIALFSIDSVLAFQSAEPATPMITTNYYYAKGGESLRSFLLNEVGVPPAVLFQQGYYQKIKEWNSRINDINRLEAGTAVYVELPYGTVLTPHKITPVQKNEQRVVESKSRSNVKKQKEKKSDQERQFSISGFYMSSTGTFQDTTGKITTTNSQNSPYTFGISGHYRPQDAPYAISFSSYLSHN